MKTYNRLFLANPTDRKWNPVELLGSALELHGIPFHVCWICSEHMIILSSSPAHATVVPITAGSASLHTRRCQLMNYFLISEMLQSERLLFFNQKSLLWKRQYWLHFYILLNIACWWKVFSFLFSLNRPLRGFSLAVVMSTGRMKLWNHWDIQAFFWRPCYGQDVFLDVIQCTHDVLMDL